MTHAPVRYRARSPDSPTESNRHARAAIADSSPVGTELRPPSRRWSRRTAGPSKCRAALPSSIRRWCWPGRRWWRKFVPRPSLSADPSSCPSLRFDRVSARALAAVWDLSSREKHSYPTRVEARRVWDCDRSSRARRRGAAQTPNGDVSRVILQPEVRDLVLSHQVSKRVLELGLLNEEVVLG